jgi:hypothetical protein
MQEKKKDEEIHAAQDDEEDEPTVFMVSAVAIQPVTDQAHPTAVHLDMGKLFIQLGENGSARWILDSGATNHMTGVRKVFSEIDLRVHDMVHFGDGSVMNIEGRGGPAGTRH